MPRLPAFMWWNRPVSPAVARPEAVGHVAVRPLDLHDVGAEVGEDPPDVRAGDRLREVEDAAAGQRARGFPHAAAAYGTIGRDRAGRGARGAAVRGEGRARQRRGVGDRPGDRPAGRRRGRHGGRRRRRRRRACSRCRTELGDAVGTFVGDVTVEADAEALVALAVDRFGGLDVAFHVAGASRAALIVDLTEEDWDFTVDLCLKGVFFGIKHAARRMIEQGRGGAIVNIASLNSRVPMFFGAAYSAAKAGVVSLGQSAALELGEHGIRVSTVSPGLTATPLVRPMTDVPAVHAAFMERIPLGRPATPEDIAASAHVPGQRRRRVRLRRQPLRRRRLGADRLSRPAPDVRRHPRQRRGAAESAEPPA